MIEIIIPQDTIDHEARDYLWRESISSLIEDEYLDPKHIPKENGTLLAGAIDTLLISFISLDNRFEQKKFKIVAPGGLNHYALHTTIVNESNSQSTKADYKSCFTDIHIIDLRQVLNGALQSGSHLSVILPKNELDKLIGWRDIHGMTLPSNASSTKIIIEYLFCLQKLIGNLKNYEQSAAKNALLLLLASSINSTSDSIILEPLGLPMRNRILGYIDDNITSPQMSPRSIQQYFRVSRSHLYRAFEKDGGVAKVIRDKRLDHAYRILLDRNGKRISLKEIAYRCGFSTGTQFAKAFRTRFSLSPKEARDYSSDQSDSLKNSIILNKKRSVKEADSNDNYNYSSI